LEKYKVVLVRQAAALFQLYLAIIFAKRTPIYFGGDRLRRRSPARHSL
jgi:hypothetical protein